MDQERSLLDFGELLAHLLDDQGRRRTWLASELEVHPSTVHRWIHGETAPPSVAIVESIATLLTLSESEQELLFTSAGYRYQPPPPAPPAAPSYSDSLLRWMAHSLRALLRWDELPTHERATLSVWTIHLLRLAGGLMTPRRALLLVGAFALGWLTSFLMGDLYRWPLPAGTARATLLASWALGGTLLPLLVAAATPPEGNMGRTPRRTLWLLKSAGAMVGFFIVSLTALGLTLLLYHVGIAPLSRRLVAAFLGAALFLAWVGARRIPADRLPLDGGRLREQPADRYFLVAGLLIHPVVALYLYLFYDLLATPSGGLWLVLLPLAIIALWEYRKAAPAPITDAVTIACLGVGVPTLLLLLLLALSGPIPRSAEAWLSLLLAFSYLVAGCSLLATHAVRGLSRCTPRALLIAEGLLAGLLLLALRQPVAALGAAAALILLWRGWGQRRFGAEWQIHYSLGLLAGAMALSLAAALRSAIPLPLNLLALVGVALLLAAWAYRAPRLPRTR